MSSGEYDDIINLPHHVSEVHPRMSLHDRAAQFAPFSALVGYEEALEEVARQTEEKRDLSLSEQAELNRRLSFLKRNEERRPAVKVTVFRADSRKAGGHYEVVEGRVRTVSEAEKLLFFEDGTVLNLEDIGEIAGPAFEQTDLGLQM